MTVAPWGTHQVLDEGPGFKVKKLVIQPGHRLSQQRHACRAERWTIVSGSGTAEVGRRKFSLKGYLFVTVDVGVVHRLTCTGDEPLVVVEVQLGACHEDDIERLQDDYGRPRKQ